MAKVEQPSLISHFKFCLLNKNSLGVALPAVF